MQSDLIKKIFKDGGERQTLMLTVWQKEALRKYENDPEFKAQVHEIHKNGVCLSCAMRTLYLTRFGRVNE